MISIEKSFALSASEDDVS